MENEDSIIDFSEYNSNFKGYELLNLETEVLGLFIENKSVDNISEGHEGIIIIKETPPFYAESGGQVGDTGYIKMKIS